MSVVCHIAVRAEWELALAAGAYRTGSLDVEGFIHCSTPEQVTATANRFFAGRTDLIVLLIDTERLGAPLRYEAAPDVPGALFPHVFGPIDLGAVFNVAALETADGRFRVHPEIAALAAAGDRTAEQAEALAMAIMSEFQAGWWIAGGWALELHAKRGGHQLRPHADLEIAVLHRDQRVLFDHLAGWQLCTVARPGILESWDGKPLSPGVHQIWARRGARLPPNPDCFAADPTLVEFLLEEADGDSWQYRRLPAIARPLTELGAISQRDVPYLRPEIALLYKAKHMRFKDQRDGAALLPTLDAAARAWLATALDQAHPGHPWSRAIRDGGSAR